MANFLENIGPAIQANPTQALSILDRALNVLESIVKLAESNPALLNVLIGLIPKPKQ